MVLQLVPQEEAVAWERTTPVDGATQRGEKIARNKRKKEAEAILQLVLQRKGTAADGEELEEGLDEELERFVEMTVFRENYHQRSGNLFHEMGDLIMITLVCVHREISLRLIAIAINQALDTIEMAKQELQILEMMAQRRALGLPPPQPPKPDPNVPREIKYFTVDKRMQVKENIFRPHWNQPTVTIEEAGMADYKEAVERSKRQKEQYVAHMHL